MTPAEAPPAAANLARTDDGPRPPQSLPPLQQLAASAESLATRWAGRARLAAPDSRPARLASRALDRAGQAIRRAALAPTPTVLRGELFPALPGAGPTEWRYHDERWNRIIHRWEHRRMLREGRAPIVEEQPQQPAPGVIVADDTITASIPAESPHGHRDRWVYLDLDPQRHAWRDFRWRFTARRDSHFRELQFGFRYLDFYNRYRFRHEDDRFHFDIVHNGVFYNDVANAPCPMTLGRDHDIQIDVRGNRFILSVGGACVLDEVDALGLFPRGSVAIILWEDDGATPIQTTISNIRVHALDLAARSRNSRERTAP